MILDHAWSEIELAYLAGIIDGEGCLSMGNVGTSRFTSQIYIGNTNPRLIHWLHERFGGTIALRKAQKATHKPLWRWLASGNEFERILAAVKPYLVIKKEQAELLLEFRASIKDPRHFGQSKATPQAVTDRRFQIKAQIAQLNKRGLAI